MIDVVSDSGGVTVIYQDDSGNKARATVVGASVSEVESRCDKIVKKHNLPDKAQTDDDTQ